MNKLTTFLLGGILLFGAVGCDVARTSADAPTSDDGKVENPGQVQDTKEDATNEIRQKQLNSDIRAREQRNDIAGNQEKRDDSDLESEIRAKLEANIPRSKLTIQAKDGNVAIAGTVPGDKEYSTIEPLAKEITGVNNVNIDNVKVVPGPES
ncbi:BON domain-containing protein [Pleurocapsa sp. FMAR1]|uniref:BON domain-containing protein n=1 Tax=Pleurocapsa sp. FMAR1 TaxID=3040204 RepID=UPI0029C67F18|nr:BON domain-containing protein [Pleurocapsa sp. FMAR1]